MATPHDTMDYAFCHRIFEAPCEFCAVFYEVIVTGVALYVRMLCRSLARHAPPVCLVALGLWASLAWGGGGALQLGSAAVLAAFAVSWTELRPSGERERVLLCALCVGAALGAGVLRFQSQRWALGAALASGDQRRACDLCIDVVEGRLVFDSQTTARETRRFELSVRALELVGPGLRLRCEWNRPPCTLLLFSSAGLRLSAGAEIRAESLHGGDFFWVDVRDMRLIGGAGLLSWLRAQLVGYFAKGVSAAARKASPLAQALLLGVKDELDTEFKGLFQSAGCAHLLALSGQHLSIICALVALVGRRLTRREKLVRRISIAFAWLFVWLAGPGPSLLRAVCMLTVSEAARLLDRPQPSLAVLSHASVLLALCAPSSITSLSSVYSFSAMAGLVLFSSRFSDALKPYLPASAARALSASIAAVCGTAAVSMFCFGTFIPAGILAATAAGPVMLAFIWIALGGGILAGCVPIVGSITAPALEFLQDILTSILAAGAALPAVHVDPRGALRLVACALIALFVALVYAVPRLRWRKARRTIEALRACNPRLRSRGGCLLFDLQREGISEERCIVSMGNSALDYDSPASIRAFLERSGLATNRRFGQNFLVDRQVRARIVETLGVEAGMRVWEIGPGLGAMTELVLEKGALVTAFEIDYGFVRLLQELFAGRDNVSIVQGDMRKTWRAQADRPDRIFGNLPYNAAFDIIADLIARGCTPPRMLFTLQREAVGRMTARPGAKDYAALSVFCASVCEARVLFEIGSSAFWPQPRVTSAVVQLVPKEESVPLDQRRMFFDFVRAAFSSRRKTMRNALRLWGRTTFPSLGEKRFEALLQESLWSIGFGVDVRAEVLDPEQLFCVYSALMRASGSGEPRSHKEQPRADQRR